MPLKVVAGASWVIVREPSTTYNPVDPDTVSIVWVWPFAVKVTGSEGRVDGSPFNVPELGLLVGLGPTVVRPPDGSSEEFSGPLLAELGLGSIAECAGAKVFSADCNTLKASVVVVWALIPRTEAITPPTPKDLPGDSCDCCAEVG